MEIISSIEEISGTYCVVFGNFDGVHLGHQYLLELTSLMASKSLSKVCLVTFSPHPHVFFKNRERFLLTDEVIKQRLVATCGVDYYYSIPFDRSVASLDATSFLEKYVVTQELRGIVIGHDFALGKNRHGDYHFFQAFCKQNNLDFQQSQTLYLNRIPCSSSIIRDALHDDRLERASALLGRPFELSGYSSEGKGLGKRIGIPTINLYPTQEQFVPMKGVYVTRVIYKNRQYKAVTNVGVNPTTDRDERIKVESHILDRFEEDVTPEHNFRVLFYKKIRPELKFDSIDDLKKQIGLDIEVALNEKV